METLLFILILGAALLLFLFYPSQGQGWMWATSVCLIGCVAFGQSAWRSRTNQDIRSDRHLAARTPHQGRIEDGLVSSGACLSCHPDQYASWHASYHRTMTQVMEPGALIAGDFDGVSLALDGLVFQLEKRGDEYWVQVNNGIRKRLVLATGSHHYQVYWIATGRGKELETFPFVYLIQDKRWVEREAVFLRPPEAGRFLQAWNNSCIKCHSTYGQRRLNPQTGIMDTRVGEMGIACESCHGEGRTHITANRNPLRRYWYYLSAKADSTIVNPERLSAQRASQVCGQCHSIFSAHNPEQWNAIGYTYRPGDDLLTTRTIVQPTRESNDPWLDFFLQQYPDYFEKQFWPDGMIRVSGREYNGLIESSCAKSPSFSCLSCHALHKSDPNDLLAAGMSGNEACLPCHQTYRLRIEAHTHHPPESSGSLCYNCHMPPTTLGLLKAIRSHTVSSPSVAVSVENGRPNACNLCHLDRTMGWTAKHLSAWYNQPDIALDGENRSVSAALLWLLRGDAAQRSLVAWSMGWDPALEASGREWEAPFLAHLLKDPYSAVRYVAHRSLKRLPGYDGFGYDFVGSPEESARAEQNALALWHRQSAGQLDRVGEHILIAPSGTLQTESILRIARQRDNRWIELLE